MRILLGEFAPLLRARIHHSHHSSFHAGRPSSSIGMVREECSSRRYVDLSPWSTSRVSSGTWTHMLPGKLRVTAASRIFDLSARTPFGSDPQCPSLRGVTSRYHFGGLCQPNNDSTANFTRSCHEFDPRILAREATVRPTDPCRHMVPSSPSRYPIFPSLSTQSFTKNGRWLTLRTVFSLLQHVTANSTLKSIFCHRHVFSALLAC